MNNFREVNGGRGKGCRGSHPGDKEDFLECALFNEELLFYIIVAPYWHPCMMLRPQARVAHFDGRSPTSSRPPQPHWMNANPFACKMLIARQLSTLLLLPLQRYDCLSMLELCCCVCQCGALEFLVSLT